MWCYDGQVRALSARWVAVSYFTVAGAVLVAHCALAIHDLRSEGHSYGLYAVGGGVGGWCAARASRGRTVAEGALGAALVAATMALLSLLTDLAALTEGFDRADVPIGAVVVTLAAAVAGGNLGERFPPRNRDSAVRWAGLAALHVVGGCFALGTAAVMILESFHGISIALLGVLGFIASPMLGGAVTQLASPTPAAGRVLGSSLVLAGGLTVLALTERWAWDSVTTGLGTLVCATFVCGVGSAGASFVYKRGWQCPPESGELPRARAR